MTYNLVKTSIPSLIDKQLAMKIAKINNIDYTTGLSLPEPPKLPSQFELLCSDIKESIFLFIRKNIIMILIAITIIILLIMRYNQVQKEKKIKLEKLKLIEKEMKNNINKNIISDYNNIFTTEPANTSIRQEPNNELDMIRKSFNNYDDTKIRNSILDEVNNNNWNNPNYKYYNKYHGINF